MSKLEFLTPVGRLVQGNCFEPNSSDRTGKVYLNKHGVPTPKYFIAVAFKKNDPDFLKLKQDFEQVARLNFPNLFTSPDGKCSHPNFSYKIVDGDGIDSDGRPNNTKDGFAGHWILRSSGNYPYQCFAAGKYRPDEQLSIQGGVNPIPCGHYVRLHGHATGNGGGNGKPGIYINVSMIEWAGIGEIITQGADAAQVFGAKPLVLPTPTTPQPIQSAPAPITPIPAPPPYPQILRPPVKQMTALAAGVTYEQYVSAGWTDAQLIAQGLLV